MPKTTKVKLLQDGLPFVVIQYHPLAFLQNRGWDIWKALLTSKIFATKVFPEEVSIDKKLEFYESKVPGTYSQLKVFTSAENEKYKFSLTVARVNEIDGVSKEINFFKDFLEPQDIEWAFLEIVNKGAKLFTDKFSVGIDQSFKKNAFIEPPKALIFGLDGILPSLYHVDSVSFKVKDHNSYNYPTIASIDIELTKIPGTPFERLKESFDNSLDLIVSDLRDWTYGRSTYQGNYFGLLMQFMDSFEYSGISGAIASFIAGVLGDSGKMAVSIESDLFVNLYNMTQDPIFSMSLSKGIENFLRKYSILDIASSAVSGVQKASILDLKNRRLI